MNTYLKIIITSCTIFMLAVLPSKAFIMDVWEFRGLTSQEVSEATIAFKEKAMEGGATVSYTHLTLPTTSTV